MDVDDYNCVLCSSSIEESRDHLFFDCAFVQSCWQLLNLHIGNFVDPMQMVSAFKSQLNMPFYMDVIILMPWAIWMVRNEAIFRGVQPSLQGCKTHFQKEFALLLLREKKDHPQLMSSWI
ncbi:hypothetical protein HU200_061195 [Digitaria exilis]|uniref:Reverse transcriptase zinc-binding domain-containing protein n=1 Tax=Digitaria exilis TaxID=1010633 RepID=A0A835DWV0_9POAL|nr:hypothetical protein HU200_061195 [Digitaria exilis]